jgi:hypothetical protein
MSVYTKEYTFPIVFIPMQALRRKQESSDLPELIVVALNLFSWLWWKFQPAVAVLMLVAFCCYFLLF